MYKVDYNYELKKYIFVFYTKPINLPMEMLNQPKDNTILICPKCKDGKLQERVPRSKFVKTFLFFIPLKRYKCYKCYKKPYVLKRN